MSQDLCKLESQKERTWIAAGARFLTLFPNQHCIRRPWKNTKQGSYSPRCPPISCILLHLGTLVMLQIPFNFVVRSLFVMDKLFGSSLNFQDEQSESCLSCCYRWDSFSCFLSPSSPSLVVFACTIEQARWTKNWTQVRDTSPSQISHKSCDWAYKDKNGHIHLSQIQTHSKTNHIKEKYRTTSFVHWST